MLRSRETVPSSVFPSHRQGEVKADSHQFTGGFLGAISRARASSHSSRARRLRTNAALAALVTVMAAVGLLVVCYRADFRRVAQGASGRSLASQRRESDDDLDREQSFILDACLNLQSEIAYEAPGEATSQLGSREEAVAGILASIQKEASQFNPSIPVPLFHKPTFEAPREVPAPYHPYAPWGLWAEQSSFYAVAPEAAQPPISSGAGPSTNRGVTSLQQQAGLPAPVADSQGLFVAGLRDPGWGHPSSFHDPSTSVSVAERWSTPASGNESQEAQEKSATSSFQQVVPEAHVTSQSSYLQETPNLFWSEARPLQAEPSRLAVQYSEEELSSWQKASRSSSNSDSSTQGSSQNHSDEDLSRSPELTGERKRPEKRKQSEGDLSAVPTEEKRARLQVFSSDEDDEEIELARSPSPRLPSSIERFDFEDLKRFFSSPGALKVENGFLIVTAALGTVYKIPHPPERPRIGDHPFYSLPILMPGPLTRGFDLSAIINPPFRVKAPLRCLKRAYELLKKHTLEPNQTQVLVFLAEGLVRYLVLRHRTILPTINYSQTVNKLGMRFMVLDAIVSLLHVLGPAMLPHLWWDSFVRWVPTDYQPRQLLAHQPRAAEYRELSVRLSNAAKTLKQGLRLSQKETVELKRDLLTTLATSHFRDKKWDMWRRDDERFQQAYK